MVQLAAVKRAITWHYASAVERRGALAASGDTPTAPGPGHWTGSRAGELYGKQQGAKLSLRKVMLIVLRGIMLE